MALVSFLRFHCKLRLHCGWDPIHEAVNTVDRALRLAGLWPALLDLTLAWKLPWGPWLSLGFWRKLQQASRTACKVAQSTGGLMQWLLEHVEAENAGTGGLANITHVWDAFLKSGTQEKYL